MQNTSEINDRHPALGWTNAIPDAESIVDVTIQERRIKFSGRGYHDKVST